MKTKVSLKYFVNDCRRCPAQLTDRGWRVQKKEKMLDNRTSNLTKSLKIIVFKFANKLLTNNVKPKQCQRQA